MPELSQETIQEIRDKVCLFFSEECDVPVDKITDDTNIINELQGDSLMLLSLLESFRKKYKLSIELKTLGKHLMKKPANTVGQVIELTTQIVRHGDNIISLDI